jgi:hypothetical protein
MKATLIPVGLNELLGSAINVMIQVSIELSLLRSMPFNSTVL